MPEGSSRTSTILLLKGLKTKPGWFGTAWASGAPGRGTGCGAGGAGGFFRAGGAFATDGAASFLGAGEETGSGGVSWILVGDGIFRCGASAMIGAGFSHEARTTTADARSHFAFIADQLSGAGEWGQ